MMALSAGNHYRPLHVFSEAEPTDSCLVILNSKLNGLETIIRKYWKKFALHLCADGGSNRLFDIAEEDRDEYIPHSICGDLDSARDDVLHYYAHKGTNIVEVEDQDNTDFTKTLQEAFSLRRCGFAKFSSIYVMNSFGGRFDQTIGNVHTVMSLDEGTHGVPVYLLSDDSIAFILKPGKNTIAVDSGLESGHCGLLPMGDVCNSCTTSGLKWNLCGEELKFGRFISTCNVLQNPHAVHVDVSSQLIWTMSHTLCT